VWFQEIVLSGTFQTKVMISTLLQEISMREDDCLDLITNYISIIKGYTFFATELPCEHTNEHFFGNEAPVEALTRAIERFLKSIRPNE
jgi:hypothetical protein